MSSRLIVNSIRHTGASSDAITLDSAGNITCNGTATGFGGGKLLQVVSTNKTDTFSASIGKQSFSGAAISVSITPANSSNKIILVAKLR